MRPPTDMFKGKLLYCSAQKVDFCLEGRAMDVYLAKLVNQPSKDNHHRS